MNWKKKKNFTVDSLLFHVPRLQKLAHGEIVTTLNIIAHLIFFFLQGHNTKLSRCFDLVIRKAKQRPNFLFLLEKIE